MNPYDLTGRVALVTGAGIGIGRAAALALAGAGAFVGLHYHQSQREAEKTLADIEAAGGHGFLLPADLTVEDEAVAVVGGLVRETNISTSSSTTPGRPCRVPRSRIARPTCGAAPSTST